ncbi:septum formation initiator family protein, partial [Acidobacteria bacterium ACD]|nr:septum formation initiator family protein [Acidobacteria bacterium ACD]
LEVRRQRQRLAELQSEISALAAENEQLEAEVSRLEKDPAAVEKIAREELNFVRPGDVVLVLPPGWEGRVKGPPPGGAATPAPAPEVPR